MPIQTDVDGDGESPGDDDGVLVIERLGVIVGVLDIDNDGVADIDNDGVFDIERLGVAEIDNDGVIDGVTDGEPGNVGVIDGVDDIDNDGVFDGVWVDDILNDGVVDGETATHIGVHFHHYINMLFQQRLILCSKDKVHPLYHQVLYQNFHHWQHKMRNLL